MAETSSPPHLLNAFRQLLGSLLAMAQTRLSLASIELSEERDRIMKVALIGILGLVFFGLAMVALSVLIVLLAWENWRWQALILLTLLYIGIVGLCLWKVRALLQRAPVPFETTLAELEKDCNLFR